MTSPPLPRTPDVPLLFVTRAARLFAYGFLALVLMAAALDVAGTRRRET